VTPEKAKILSDIRVAIIRGDATEATRLYVTHKISKKTFKAIVTEATRARRSRPKLEVVK
jgi:hypothetical protein